MLFLDCHPSDTLAANIKTISTWKILTCNKFLLLQVIFLTLESKGKIEWQFCVNAGIHKFLSCCASGGSMALQETVVRKGCDKSVLPLRDNIFTGMNLIFT